MTSPEVTDKLIYTQSAKNCWCQYLGGRLISSRKVANMWCWVADPDTCYSSSHLLLSPALLNNLLPYTIFSLPPIQELCSVMVSGSKFLWVEITGRERKWKESSRNFKTFELQLCYFLQNITNTKEKEMATHSSILSWKSHGQKSLVGNSPCVTRVGHDWTNLACTQARMLSWSSSLIWGK